VRHFFLPLIGSLLAPPAVFDRVRRLCLCRPLVVTPTGGEFSEGQAFIVMTTDGSRLLKLRSKRQNQYQYRYLAALLLTPYSRHGNRSKLKERG